MTNLMDSVKGLLTDAVIDKASSLIGLERAITSSAIEKFLPAIIGGLAHKGSTESGATMLLDLFAKKGFGESNVNDLVGILEDSHRSKSFLETGADLLGTIFGSKQSSILDTLLGMTGLKRSGGSMLLKFLAPLVINKLAGLVFSNKWGASKLASYLREQKSIVSKLIPGLDNMLGFAADSGPSVKTTATSESSSSGGGFIKWLLPLLLGALAIWYFAKDGCGHIGDKDGVTTETVTPSEEGNNVMVNSETDTKNDETAGTDVESHSIEETTNNYAALKVVDNGDVVDVTGEVVYASGTYALDSSGNLIADDGRILISSKELPQSLLQRLKAFLGKFAGYKLQMDDAGNLVDASGKIVMKKGEYIQKNGFYYDKQGNKLGRIWSKIVKAVVDAANKTVDGMKKLFANMVKKKAGVKSDYTLSKITFNDQNQRITNFSKAEVMGLAAALKENADGKIVVSVMTNDGKDDIENKKLSTSRAKVVHDMLVTLGVSKSQISYEGNGTGANKVMIKVK